MPLVNSDFYFDDACALRTKRAKDLSIVANISRDIIVNVEEIDEDTLEEDEQDVPEQSGFLCLPVSSRGIFMLNCLLNQNSISV